MVKFLMLTFLKFLILQHLVTGTFTFPAGRGQLKILDFHFWSNLVANSKTKS